MDVIEFLSEFFPMGLLLPLMAGTVVKVMFLLLIAGWAIQQIYRRPRAAKWLLAAIALTIVWDGGLSFIALYIGTMLASLLPNGAGVVGTIRSGIMNNLWVGSEIVVEGIVWACLFRAAFGAQNRRSPEPFVEAPLKQGI